LDFTPGFFEEEVDVQAHVWAYKKQREVMRRTGMFAGEVPLGHPKFPEGSPAGLVLTAAGAEGEGNGEKEKKESVEDIVYSAEDDKAIEHHLRENIATTWHSLGTAKMAKREEGGVVGSRLDVFGVEGLKVVDLSIVPGNVGANTNNTALMVGEKGAALVAEDLGLVLV
jgi:alcohol oxidase